MIELVKRKIAVKPILDPDKSQGGIWIPDIAKERTDQGIVKYVGPNCKDVQVGDYILFSAYTGTTVQFEQDGDGVLIIFDERFAVCKLHNPDTNINGLYFKAKVEPEEIEDLKHEIERVISVCVNTNNISDDAINMILALMLKHESAKYFSATYEMAMNLIAESFRHTDFAKGVGIKNPLESKPSIEDYEELEDD